MSELVTLSTTDGRFKSYMQGSFSSTHRALPVQSLNINTDAEQITFRIVALKDIKRPIGFLLWPQVLKARNFLLVAFPIFLVFQKLWLALSFHDPLGGLTAAISAVFLMAAVNLFNDYQDHLSGLDRILPRSGSRAIQNGWVSAQAVFYWACLYLALGFAFGLRPLLQNAEIFYLVVVIIGLGALGFATHRMGLKYHLWSEWAVFLLLGPFLTLGLQFSAGAGFDFQCLFLGFLTGGLAAFYLHLKNFEQLMINDQAKFLNSIRWLGFEHSKWYLAAWWVIQSAVMIAYEFFYAGWLWAGVWLVLCFGLGFPFSRQLFQLQSPLGSGMRRLIETGRMLILCFMGLAVIEGLLSTFWMQV